MMRMVLCAVSGAWRPPSCAALTSGTAAGSSRRPRRAWPPRTRAGPAARGWRRAPGAPARLRPPRPPSRPPPPRAPPRPSVVRRHQEQVRGGGGRRCEAPASRWRRRPSAAVAVQEGEEVAVEQPALVVGRQHAVPGPQVLHQLGSALLQVHRGRARSSCPTWPPTSSLRGGEREETGSGGESHSERRRKGRGAHAWRAARAQARDARGSGAWGRQSGWARADLLPSPPRRPISDADAFPNDFLGLDRRCQRLPVIPGGGQFPSFPSASPHPHCRLRTHPTSPVNSQGICFTWSPQEAS